MKISKTENEKMHKWRPGMHRGRRISIFSEEYTSYFRSVIAFGNARIVECNVKK